MEKDEVDLVVFATMTPDHYFPGCGTLLQDTLGLRPVPCFDIRQQCSGFLYGLQLADAHIRAGMAKTVLLVGAEVHTGFMPWARENCAYALGRRRTCPRRRRSGTGTPASDTWWSSSATPARRWSCAPEDGDRGVIDHDLHGAGADYDKLYVPGTGFSTGRTSMPGRSHAATTCPVMDGRFVFKMATTRMAEVAQDGPRAQRRGSRSGQDGADAPGQQADQRVRARRSWACPTRRCLHNIHKYGNTTAATIPLLWDECVRDGRISPGTSS